MRLTVCMWHKVIKETGSRLADCTKPIIGTGLLTILLLKNINLQKQYQEDY